MSAAVLVVFGALLLLALAACGGRLLILPALVVAPPPAASIPSAGAHVMPVSELRQASGFATVQRAGARGHIILRTDVGELVIPVAPRCADKFAAGQQVRVFIAAQEVALAERPSPAHVPSAPTARSVAYAPATYSTLIGTIEAVASDGRVTVDTPTGAITVWLPPAPWRLGHPVQVWTWIDPRDGCALNR